MEMTPTDKAAVRAGAFRVETAGCYDEARRATFATKAQAKAFAATAYVKGQVGHWPDGWDVVYHPNQPQPPAQ